MLFSEIQIKKKLSEYLVLQSNIFLYFCDRCSKLKRFFFHFWTYYFFHFCLICQNKMLHIFENGSYSSLWKVLIFSFVLSHGQSKIECEFNINDNLLVENLKTESLTAQRSVQDFINASEVSADKMEIDSVLIKSLRLPTVCTSRHWKIKGGN